MQLRRLLQYNFKEAFNSSMNDKLGLTEHQFSLERLRVYCAGANLHLTIRQLYSNKNAYQCIYVINNDNGGDISRRHAVLTVGAVYTYINSHHVYKVS